MAKSQASQGCGPEILLEVRPASTSGDLAPRVMVPEEFRSRAGEIADSIAEVAEYFRSRLGPLLEKGEGSAWHVGSIEVGFDIAVQAEAGVVIAKATAGTTLSARLVLQTGQDQQR